jgi:broad specificity phosphatase PhoE
VRLARALAAALLLASASASAAVFLVRHAEKRNPKDDKSLLSARGLQRAKDLSRALSSVPLKAVYATEYQRTQQTAAPTAAAHKLKTVVLPSDDAKGLVRLLRAWAPDEDVLVVGHSDTIPDILAGLGVSTPTAIAPDDYDELFVVTPRASGEPEFHRLHYGAAPAADAPAPAMSRGSRAP